MEIITDAQLLARIEAFLKRSGMKHTAFGRAAMKDPALYKQLKAGKRSVSLKSAERILAFINAWTAEAEAAERAAA